VSPIGEGEGFWLFSRTPTVEPAQLEKIRQAALAMGFDLSVLRDVLQVGCNYFPFPQEAKIKSRS
jgi:lipocalin